MSRASWRGKLSFLDKPEGVKHTVAGKELMFYKVSLLKMIDLRDVYKKIGKLLSTLFTSVSNDTGSIFRKFNDGGETVVQPINVDLARFRLESQGTAIVDLIDVLSDRKNMESLGALIMDSLRDEFPRGDGNNPPPTEFMAVLDAPEIVDMVIGVAKANKGLFGPLGVQVERVFAVIKAKVDLAVQPPTPPPTPGAASSTTSSSVAAVPPASSPSSESSPSI
jgi:hypothetical protein